MKVFENVPKRLLTLFNAKYGTALTLDQVEFKNPRPTAKINPKPGTTKNTAVTLAMRPGAAYTGDTILYYDRLSLAKAWLNAPLASELPIQVENETTVHDLIPKLYRRLGVKFLTTDLVNAPLDLTAHVGRLSLTAADTSLTWVGKVEIGLQQTIRPNEFAVSYPGKLWTYDDGIQAAITSPAMTNWFSPMALSYMFDYTPQVAFLKTLVATNVQSQISSTVATNLAAALKAVDGLNWVYSTAITSFNLNGATIYYNGKVKDYPAWLALNQGYPYMDVGMLDIGLLQNPINPEYDNVMLIQPNRPWVDTSGYRSFMIIHYNDAPTTAVVEPGPKYWWPLAGDSKSAIQGQPDLTAVFDYRDLGGTLWATHNTARLDALGVSLPCVGDFTLEFKMIATTASPTNKWQGLFTNSLADNSGTPIKLTCNDYPGKWFFYIQGPTWVTNNTSATAFTPGTPHTIRFRGFAGSIEVYIDGVLSVVASPQSTTTTAWTHIGKSEQPWGPEVLIRDIKYWDKALPVS